MINHHPDARILNEFVAGSLPLAQSACVSVHLHFCEYCQRQTRQLQELGSLMFDRLSPQQVDDSLLESVMGRLDEEPPLEYAQDASSDGGPVLVQRLMNGDYEDLEWKRMNAALQISRLRTGDPEHEFALYHIKAGGSIPKHTHRGTELTLVLEGSFSDEEGVYQQGDFLLRDGEHTHTPTAAQSTDCICIGVLDAPIRFTPWNYRLLNPFLRLQAH
jgi:putative transcriptional regulator